MTRAGLPTASESEGISRETTLPAPIVTLSPIVTPGRMTAFPPIQTLSPIVTGAVVERQKSIPRAAGGEPREGILSRALTGWPTA